jgi:SAM-dependent methyltransferase
MVRVRPLSFYLFNLRLGQGTDYTRYFEYPKALQMLDIEREQRLSLLDVGSGRRGQFPLFLASKFPNLSVCCSDPRNDFKDQMQSVKKLGLNAALDSGQLRLESMDILSPTFPDESFDRITCISTVEHIPEDGDTVALRNMARLLRPGGLLVLSVPFNWYRNGENYSVGPTYPVPGSPGGDAILGRHFFERIYDPKSLQARLVAPSGLHPEKVVYFGEPGFSFGRFIHEGYRGKRLIPRVLFRLRLAHLSVPLTAPLFLKEIEPTSYDAEDWSGVGVLVSLRKQGN